VEETFTQRSIVTVKTGFRTSRVRIPFNVRALSAIDCRSFREGRNSNAAKPVILRDGSLKGPSHGFAVSDPIKRLAQRSRRGRGLESVAQNFSLFGSQAIGSGRYKKWSAASGKQIDPTRGLSSKGSAG
jgi:hypothetical protein